MDKFDKQCQRFEKCSFYEKSAKNIWDLKCLDKYHVIYIYSGSKNYSYTFVVYFSSTKFKAGKFFMSDPDSPDNTAFRTLFLKFSSVKTKENWPTH